MSSIAVVGAGIVGASVAYHLARRGVPVTLFDRAPSPAAGVTGDSFAWIGDSSGDWPGGAEDLRHFVRADYRRLEAELPAVTVRWTGSLTWTDFSTRPGSGQAWVGPDEIAALEPHLRTPPERALYTPTDGAVDPIAVTRALVDAARALGAQIALGSAVTSLRITHGHVEGVESPAGFHAASTVVLAAGTETATLAEPLGIPLPIAPSPAVLIRMAAPEGLVRTIISGPEFEAREIRPGRLVLTAPHDDRLTPAALERLAHQTRDRVASTFDSPAPLRLLGWRLGRRPMPANGPILGQLAPDQSLYVAVTHSAITLAPTVGRLIAQEIATGKPPDELRHSRPTP
jgi:glycine/D-amino acid oxidase-like deaminating enzyme